MGDVLRIVFKLRTMKRISIFLFSNLLFITSWAQVPKKVVVEHFTNTRCSICASRNPGFYTNLSNHPDVLHVSVHPSSPYSSCVLNNHNPVENDDRTKYYGQYGSTPKFTIQGNNVPSSQNTSNASLFTPYTGQTSEASISVSHDKSSGSDIEVNVSIKTEASHSYGNLRMFVALVEDTVAYAAPNGENEHYDVFRKSMTDIEGDVVNLPANVGDSLTFTFTESVNSDWSLNRMYALVILQEESNKAVVQSGASMSEPTGNPVGIAESKEFEEIKIYPNPASNDLNLYLPNKVNEISLNSITGEVVYADIQIQSGNHTIDVSDLTKGIYFLQIINRGEVFVQKVIVN